jgi:hypothetical protein
VDVTFTDVEEGLEEDVGLGEEDEDEVDMVRDL